MQSYRIHNHFDLIRTIIQTIETFRGRRHDFFERAHPEMEDIKEQIRVLHNSQPRMLFEAEHPQLTEDAKEMLICVEGQLEAIRLVVDTNVSLKATMDEVELEMLRELMVKVRPLEQELLSYDGFLRRLLNLFGWGDMK